MAKKNAKTGTGPGKTVDPIGQDFSVEYFWDGADWFAESSSTIDGEVLAMKEPDNSVRDALQAFHRRFYPDETEHKFKTMATFCATKAKGDIERMVLDGKTKEEIRCKVRKEHDPIHDDFIPAWVGHFAGKKFYKILGAECDSVIGEHAYVESLGRRLSASWLLSWHWRAILPYCLRTWDKKNPRPLVTQISQIRQWELLLCYYLDDDVEPDKLPSLDRNDVKLMRAPLFGISHRTMHWDVYRLFYREQFKKDLVGAVKETTNATGSKSAYSQPLSLAYVIGRHDCYYKVTKIERDDNKIRFTGKVHLELHPERSPLDSVAEGPDGDPFARPYDLVEIPAFAKKEKAPVLLASDNYCKALDQLTEVLNDVTAKSVLFVAPPGSGKEQLAKMAYWCNNRFSGMVIKKSAKPKGKFVAVSLAGLDPESVQRLLFRLPDVDRAINEKDQKLQEEFTPEPNDGLVFQAFRGALFLDEIDKATVEVRSLLLRFLESEEVTTPDTSSLVKFDSHQVPLYIFAGSMGRRDMFKLLPVDFWTRISHVVQMSHPLDVGESENVRLVTREYIAMFWRKHVTDFLEKSGHVGNQVDNYPGADLYEVVAPYFASLQRFLISPTVIRFVSRTLADEMVGRGQTLPSIRRIRGVVGRSVFQSTEMLLHAKEPGSAIEELKLKNRAKDRGFDDWFKHLCKILDGANGNHRTVPEPNGGHLKQELAFVDAFRQTLRKSAVFSS